MVSYFCAEEENMDVEAEYESTNPVDKEVHEVEDLLCGPSELGHPSLDPDELNLQA
jgi:hypothetical protein